MVRKSRWTKRSGLAGETDSHVLTWLPRWLRGTSARLPHGKTTMDSARSGHRGRSVALLACGVLVFAGCGSPSSATRTSTPHRATRTTFPATAPSSISPTTSTTTAPTTTTTITNSETAAQAQAALTPLLAPYGATYATAGVVPSTAGPLTAVSYVGSGYVGMVRIYGWQSGQWSTLATLGAGDDLPVPESSDETPILVEHFTGGADPDFYVELSASSITAAVVASNEGGTWHLIVIDHPGTNDYFTDPTVSGTKVTETTDNCQPDCAAGTETATSYTYSRTSGEFVPAASPQATTPSSSTIPAATDACPTGPQLFTAWTAQPGIYNAPTGWVTGFVDVICWNTYAAATTAVANVDQDQVEEVVFSTVGGLHGLDQTELNTLTNQVCAPGSSAPPALIGATTCPASSTATQGPVTPDDAQALSTDSQACMALAQDQSEGASGRADPAAIIAFVSAAEGASTGAGLSAQIATDAGQFAAEFQANGAENMYPTPVVGSDCAQLGVTVYSSSTP
jgi:hypothetical protein